MMKKILYFLLLVISCVNSYAQDFTVSQGQRLSIFMQEIDTPVANTALEMLTEDVKAVLGSELTRVINRNKADIIATIDTELPREGFRLHVEEGRLIIDGADAHGLAYGLLEFSRIMGVSPWEWWADCVPDKANVALYSDFITEQCPAVTYRGIFINDEDFGILPWSGGFIGPETNEKIFQLMLRLRANYYWPSMHECSRPFFTIAGNRDMAHKYGIYVGGSHCEPLATTPATEWMLRGKGEYNYATNAERIKSFWSERIRQVKDQEMVYTIGMRGLHDGAMLGAKNDSTKLALLQKVILDQRALLADELKKKPKEIPQVFIPYKEVLDIYNNGLQVPEDVTIMWTDDNFGYIRHFPTEDEMLRDGGNGLYYHVSYWGRPHDYLWLGTASPFLMRQQLTEAYMRGVQQIWVLNVGDIKPAEYLIEDFLNMAWNGLRKKTDEQKELLKFMRREFGRDVADSLVSIMADYYHLAFQRKPEHLGGSRTEEADKETWNAIRPIAEWSKEDVDARVKEYKRISDAVQALEKQIPNNRKSAYFQLVKYPVQASAQMNFKFFGVADNQRVNPYDSIVALTRTYNNKKWNGIMDMAPRNLPVFSPLTRTVPYAESKIKSDILFTTKTWKSVARDEELTFTFTNTDLTPQLEIRLLPNHPIEGKTLSFSVSIDGAKPVVYEYQTVGRSEEWKQNVLRNYAVRKHNLQFTDKGEHKIVFKALTEGVNLTHIAVNSPK
ncbi:MAG: glycosyl hydrolase 115 family protein [Bacteroidaceae bacterium]|nr:glycosyl hydrolase 115 family protein [Bacteroidaceae bacterium]